MHKIQECNKMNIRQYVTSSEKLKVEEEEDVDAQGVQVYKGQNDEEGEVEKDRSG